MLEVTAAILRDDAGRILICQRPAHKANGLLWEFPGGKLEEGETLPACLRRELAEELSITADIGEIIGETIYTYPDFTVHLTFFSARITHGVPLASEHPRILWVSPGELTQYPFCPADQPILEKLAR